MSNSSFPPDPSHSAGDVPVPAPPMTSGPETGSFPAAPVPPPPSASVPEASNATAVPPPPAAAVPEAAPVAAPVASPHTMGVPVDATPAPGAPVPQVHGGFAQPGQVAQPSPLTQTFTAWFRAPGLISTALTLAIVLGSAAVSALLCGERILWFISIISIHGPKQPIIRSYTQTSYFCIGTGRFNS